MGVGGRVSVPFENKKACQSADCADQVGQIDRGNPPSIATALASCKCVPPKSASICVICGFTLLRTCRLTRRTVRRFRRFAQILKDESLELEAGTTEVQEQASLQARGFEIVEDLGLFQAGKGLQCLELNDDIFIADEICAVCAGQPSGLVRDRQVPLSLVRDSPVRQFECQRLLIHGFQESRAKLLVHLR